MRYKYFIFSLLSVLLLLGCNRTTEHKTTPSKPAMVMASKLQNLIAKTKKLPCPTTITNQELSEVLSQIITPGGKQNLGYWPVNKDLIACLYLQNYALYYNIHLSVYDIQTGKSTADTILGSVGATRVGGTSYEHNCKVDLRTKSGILVKTKMEPVMNNEKETTFNARFFRINAQGQIQMKVF